MLEDICPEAGIELLHISRALARHATEVIIFKVVLSTYACHIFINTSYVIYDSSEY